MPENKNEEIQEEINPEETVNPEADSAQEEIDTEETCKAEAAGEDIELESAIAAAEKAGGRVLAAAASHPRHASALLAFDAARLGTRNQGAVLAPKYQVLDPVIHVPCSGA